MVKDGRLVRCIPKEVIILDSFLKAKKEAGADCHASDEEIKNLCSRLVEVREDSCLRTANAVEIALGRRRTVLESAKSKGEKIPAPKKARRKIKVSGLEEAARKILEELNPIMGFMNKPPEYLKPLESLLAGHQALAEHLKTAEEKIIAVKTASKTAKTSATAVKASVKKIKEMEKELKTLRNFLKPAKIILRETCDLRIQATRLTERAAEIKKKNGTDLIKFLQEIEDCKSLQE